MSTAHQDATLIATQAIIPNIYGSHVASRCRRLPGRPAPRPPARPGPARRRRRRLARRPAALLPRWLHVPFVRYTRHARTPAVREDARRTHRAVSSARATGDDPANQPAA